MQAYTYYCIISQTVGVMVCLLIFIFIIRYFIKELINNKEYVERDTQKRIQGKIKKEQEKVKKLLKKEKRKIK